MTAPSPSGDPNAAKVQSETFVINGKTYQSPLLDKSGSFNVNNSGSEGVLPVSYNNLDTATKKQMEKQLKGKGEEYIYFPSNVGEKIKMRYINGKPVNALIEQGGKYNSNLEQSVFRTGKALNTKATKSDQNVNDQMLTENQGKWNPVTQKWEN